MMTLDFAELRAANVDRARHWHDGASEWSGARDEECAEERAKQARQSQPQPPYGHPGVTEAE
jgi:hypothetical protein